MPRPTRTTVPDRRHRRPLVVGGIAVGTTLLAAAALAITGGAADAHHADVSVLCLAAPGTVRITATAWDAPTPEGRINHSIAIAYDGATVATGAFTAENGYSFTIDFVAPDATGSHTVRATATSAWGPNETIRETGEVREATVSLPCGPALVLPEVVVVTTTSTTSTTSTVPVEVLDSTVTRVPAAALPVEVLPRFAG